MSPQEIQAFAAGATFLAAVLAVWATFRAPKLAAQFAERLRVEGQKGEEERRLKVQVFTTLMQNRAQIAGSNAVSALNVIDVVFCESPEVREAWRHFRLATDEQPYSAEKVVERYLSIIEKMARDLGLARSITISDIQACYYPEKLGHMDEAAYWEAQAKLRKFKTESP